MIKFVFSSKIKRAFYDHRILCKKLKNGILYDLLVLGHSICSHSDNDFSALFCKFPNNCESFISSTPLLSSLSSFALSCNHFTSFSLICWFRWSCFAPCSLPSLPLRQAALTQPFTHIPPSRSIHWIHLRWFWIRFIVIVSFWLFWFVSHVRLSFIACSWSFASWFHSSARASISFRFWYLSKLRFNWLILHLTLACFFSASFLAVYFTTRSWFLLCLVPALECIAGKRCLVSLQSLYREFLGLTLGAAIHSAEDFYSHSNWIELKHAGIAVLTLTGSSPTRWVAFVCAPRMRNVPNAASGASLSPLFFLFLFLVRSFFVSPLIFLPFVLLFTILSALSFQMHSLLVKHHQFNLHRGSSFWHPQISSLSSWMVPAWCWCTRCHGAHSFSVARSLHKRQAVPPPHKHTHTHHTPHTHTPPPTPHPPTHPPPPPPRAREFPCSVWHSSSACTVSSSLSRLLPLDALCCLFSFCCFRSVFFQSRIVHDSKESSSQLSTSCWLFVLYLYASVYTVYSSSPVLTPIRQERISYGDFVFAFFSTTILSSTDIFSPTCTSSSSSLHVGLVLLKPKTSSSQCYHLHPSILLLRLP